tara:strand:+ start:1054 stop:1440 length:387 start_codon:yes stop_codon:yes gene_type:complete
MGDMVDGVGWGWSAGTRVMTTSTHPENTDDKGTERDAQRSQRRSVSSVPAFFWSSPFPSLVPRLSRSPSGHVPGLNGKCRASERGLARNEKSDEKERKWPSRMRNQSVECGNGNNPRFSIPFFFAFSQ